MKYATNFLMLCVVLLALSSCATRTIYIPYGEPVRLREDIPNAKVWVKDANNVDTPGVVTLNEGWYALPLTDRKPTE